MLKIYHESTEFNRFSRFDTKTGRLSSISEEEFGKFLSNDPQMEDKPVQRIEGKEAIVFLGETPKTRTRFPRRVYFQITRNCNLECPACFIKAEKKGQHVPTSAIMELAEFMGRNGLMEVRLTGGEPTTHPDFFDILHKFQDEGVYVSVATNGVFNQRTLDALCEEPNLWVICSVDGNRETHNRYRPNTFDKIITNLKYLKNKNPATRLRLTTVLTKENQSQVFELGQICKSVSAESITIIPLRPQVRDQKIKDEMVTAREFKQVLDELVVAKEKLGIQFTTTIETDYKAEIYSDPVFTKRSSCAAGREGANLDYDAEKNEFLVYGCSYSPASDLLENPVIRKPFLAGTFTPDNIPYFLDIWRNEDAWTIFRDLSLKPDSCQKCEYLQRHLCTGSCPIQNIDYASIDVDGNVLEQLKESIHRTGEWYCYKNVVQENC